MKIARQRASYKTNHPIDPLPEVIRQPIESFRRKSVSRAPRHPGFDQLPYLKGM